MSKHWTQKNIGDQTGRVAIVTGSNTGIGKETVRHLAGAGATVIMACRNSDKANQAAEDLRSANPKGAIEVEILDLADLSSVRDFADRIKASHQRLDLLVNNAGVMVPPESKTNDGFELQFGVNHLGHFALTGQLMDLLAKTPGSRVVTVSSVAHKFGEMDFDDLNWESRTYKKWPSYGQSKLANLLFTLELQKRLAAAKLDVKATAAHPGWTATDLQRHTLSARIFNPLFAMKPWKGALPTVRAAVDPTIEGGEYFGPHGIGNMRGWPVVETPKATATNEDDAARLWEVSEQLTGVRFDALGQAAA